MKPTLPIMGLAALLYSQSAMAQPSPEPDVVEKKFTFLPTQYDIRLNNTPEMMLYNYKLSAPTTFPAASMQLKYTPKPDSWLIPSLHAVGILAGMTIGEMILWPDNFANPDPEYAAENYKNAFTEPPKWDPNASIFEWDGDKWPINVIGHGLFGMEVFRRYRTCGRNQWEALLMTTLVSAAWEYGIEARGVQPSGQDLILTPMYGWILGEGIYQLHLKAGEIDDKTWRGIVQGALDPFGEFERKVLGTDC